MAFLQSSFSLSKFLFVVFWGTYWSEVPFSEGKDTYITILGLTMYNKKIKIPSRMEAVTFLYLSFLQYCLDFFILLNCYFDMFKCSMSSQSCLAWSELRIHFFFVGLVVVLLIKCCFNYLYLVKFNFLLGWWLMVKFIFVNCDILQWRRPYASLLLMDVCCVRQPVNLLRT